MLVEFAQITCWQWMILLPLLEVLASEAAERPPERQHQRRSRSIYRKYCFFCVPLASRPWKLVNSELDTLRLHKKLKQILNWFGAPACRSLSSIDEENGYQ